MGKCRILIALALSLVCVAASAAGTHSVRGYTTKGGTYVEPHRQTNPNGTQTDNWSTKGNVNPNTGKPGTKAPTK